MKWGAVKQIEGENVWVTFAKKQTSIKNNCINLVCTGGVGTGKSWALLSYFYLIDPDFDLNEQAFFKAKGLMRKFERGGVIKGKPFLFDESGIDANSSKWQDEINKGLNAFLQTGRHRNYIFGMTVPFMSFLSKGVRTLMNCHWRAEGWNSLNQTRVKPFMLQYNGDMDKFYRKRLIVKTDIGSSFCNELRLPKPPRPIVREYEKLKKEFTAELFKDIGDKIESKEDKKESLKLIKCSKLRSDLNVVPSTIYTWINKKMFEAKKIGDIWFMTKQEYEKVLNDPFLLRK